ncbi:MULTISPECIES: type II toxin-antitoxin system HicA family toxin [Aphanothece]|uniref:type II toxin-antitoxin system HicA family toxin n=1 Tax=Aphanothece TaxID=1121 RepID=UPI003984BF4B
MPRLPGISQKEAVRVFQKLGYRVVRESGHLIMSNAITMGASALAGKQTPEALIRADRER